MGCPICAWTSANTDFLLLGETPAWRVCLAPNQSQLGRSVIHLKRHAGDLADLTAGEMLEFLQVVRGFENALSVAYKASMFNWSCYMNLSYREPRPDPHVHWWAVPRYGHAVLVEGASFEDPQFGSPYDHARIQEVPLDLRTRIADEIRSHLSFAAG